MTPHLQAQLTTTLENYFIGLMTTRTPEPPQRLLELASILLTVGAYPEMRDYFLLFVDEIARQLATVSNGSGKA
jgi:hypothetical protein